MPYSVKGFFEINEDMVQILLMLEVLFTQNSKVEDLFCGASSLFKYCYIYRIFRRAKEYQLSTTIQNFGKIP